MILALDTSGRELLVALIGDAGLIDGRVSSGARHQDRIVELIGEVAGASLGALDAVAVARGPGSHTGIRVGLSTAAGIAFSRRLTIHPLSSLAVAAHRAGDASGPVLAMVGAGRGRAYVQAFDGEGWSRRPAGKRRVEPLAQFDPAGLPAVAESAVLAQLRGPRPACDRNGTEALTAAVLQAVETGETLNYDQLTGDYGEI